jgi:gas vesicle protein
MLDKQRLRTFVLGGIAGALAGILFAPKSGKELRGSITSRAGEARERGRETYFEAQERMQERIAEVRERPPRQR